MKFFIYIAAFIFYLFWPSSALAVSITISDYPSTITDDAFTITASISGATTNTNYLRVDVYKEGSTNYFGETFNNSDWYGGSTFSQYMPISIQSGVVWSGQIQGRVGSPTTTQYDGSGSYKVRLRRYTGSGGYTATEANNSSVSVLILLPTPTPTSTPTSVPTAAATQTSTPTLTSAPTATPTKSPTPTSKPSITIVLSKEPDEEILGESITPSEAEKALLAVAKKEEKKSSIMPLVFISLGVILLAVCGILFYSSLGGRIPFLDKFLNKLL